MPTWNVKESGSGYVTRFVIAAEVFAKFKVETVGGATHQELWVPAGELTTGIPRPSRSWSSNVATVSIDVTPAPSGGGGGSGLGPATVSHP